MFDEELAVHLLATVEHLQFAREMLLRVGNVEAFERYGWSFGEECYTGQSEPQVLEDQLNTVLKMTEPGLAADLSFIYYLNEGRDDWWRGLLHADGTRVEGPEELPLQELDYAHALTVYSSHGPLVRRYRRDLARQRPNLQFFTYAPEPPRPPPVRPATRRRPPPHRTTKPNFLIFVDPWDSRPLDTVYDLARALVHVWELGASQPAGATNPSGRSQTTFHPRTTFGRSRRPGRRAP